MNLNQLLFDLLNKNEEARKTDNLYRVFEYVMRAYKAITPEGQWDSAAYKAMPGLQTIDRLLRKVKEENGWQDERARELEKQHREAFRHQYEHADKPISIVDKNVKDIEAEELMAAVKAKHPGISGKDLMLAVAEEQRIKIRNYDKTV